MRIRNIGGNTFRYNALIPPNEDSVAELVRCGRTRWKIEIF